MSYSQIIPSERTFAIAYDGTSFTVGGTSGVTLALKRGQTYRFDLDTSVATHPFYIKTTNVDDTNDLVSDGISANGVDDGSIFYTVPSDAPDVLYYGEVGDWSSINVSYEQIVVDRVNTFEEWRVKTNVLADTFGDFETLGSNFTSTDVVSSLNQLRTNSGEPTSLTTSNTTNLVSAINELDSEIGTISSLTTDSTTDLVTAINELETNHNALDAAAQKEGADIHVSNVYVDSNNSTSSHTGEKIRLYDNSGSFNIVSTTTGASAEILSITSGTNKIFSIDGSGDSVFAGDITAFGSPSDINMKKNIAPIEDALDKVMQIGGYTFDFKEEFIKNDKQKKRQVGVIAQEIEKVLPELINEADDGYKRVDYDRIIALLIQAVKELNNKIK